MSRRNSLSSTCSVQTTTGSIIRLMSTDDLLSTDDRFARKLKKKTIPTPPLPTAHNYNKASKNKKSSFTFPNGEVFNPRNSASLTSNPNNSNTSIANSSSGNPPSVPPPVPASSQFRGGKVQQLLQKFQQQINNNSNAAYASHTVSSLAKTSNSGVATISNSAIGSYSRKNISSKKIQLANLLRLSNSDITTNLKDTSPTLATTPKLQLNNICKTQLNVLLNETDLNPLLILNYNLNRSHSNTPTTSISNSIEEEPEYVKDQRPNSEANVDNDNANVNINTDNAIDTDINAVERKQVNQQEVDMYTGNSSPISLPKDSGKSSSSSSPISADPIDTSSVNEDKIDETPVEITTGLYSTPEIAEISNTPPSIKPSRDNGIDSIEFSSSENATPELKIHYKRLSLISIESGDVEPALVLKRFTRVEEAKENENADHVEAANGSKENPNGSLPESDPKKHQDKPNQEKSVSSELTLSNQSNFDESNESNTDSSGLGDQNSNSSPSSKSNSESSDDLQSSPGSLLNKLLKDSLRGESATTTPNTTANITSSNCNTTSSLSSSSSSKSTFEAEIPTRKVIKIDPTAKPAQHSEFKVVRKTSANVLDSTNSEKDNQMTMSQEEFEHAITMVSTLEPGRLSSKPTAEGLAMLRQKSPTKPKLKLSQSTSNSTTSITNSDADGVPPRGDLIGRSYSLRQRKELPLVGNNIQNIENNTNDISVSNDDIHLLSMGNNNNNDSGSNLHNVNNFVNLPINLDMKNEKFKAPFRQSALILLLLVECNPFPISRPQLVADECDETLIEDERALSGIHLSGETDIGDDGTKFELNDHGLNSVQSSVKELDLSTAASTATAASTPASVTTIPQKIEGKDSKTESKSSLQSKKPKSLAIYAQKKFNRAEYTISPIMEFPPEAQSQEHLTSQTRNPVSPVVKSPVKVETLPSPTIAAESAFSGNSNSKISSKNEKLNVDSPNKNLIMLPPRKQNSMLFDISPKEKQIGKLKLDTKASTVTPKSGIKPLPKTPTRELLSIHSLSKQPSSSTIHTLGKSKNEKVGFVGFFKKLFKKEKDGRRTNSSVNSSVIINVPGINTLNDTSDNKEGNEENFALESPSKDNTLLDDVILPTLEPETNMFDEVLTNLDKYSRGSIVIRKSDPIFCDDELTRDQIQDQWIKDVSQPGRITEIGSRHLRENSISLADYIDENILQLRNEMGWMDEDLLEEKMELVRVVSESAKQLVDEQLGPGGKRASCHSRSYSNSDEEYGQESFVIHNQQLQNLFHNLTESQRRALPMHLKYIKQFKDYGQLEITVRTDRHIVPSHDSKPSKSSTKKAKSSNGNKVLFENRIVVNETHSPDVYKRYNKLVTQYSLTEPQQIERIKAEMNEFKCNEMLVHELLKKHTHFFY